MGTTRRSRCPCYSDLVDHYRDYSESLPCITYNCTDSSCVSDPNVWHNCPHTLAYHDWTELIAAHITTSACLLFALCILFISYWSHLSGLQTRYSRLVFTFKTCLRIYNIAHISICTSEYIVSKMQSNLCVSHIMQLGMLYNLNVR